MVISEQDGVIYVNSGAPDAWLSPGKHIVLQHAPTEYGLVNVSFIRSDSDLSIRLEGAPPQGWRVRIPDHPDALLPSGSQSLVVHYSE
jgi:hypothetical protein